MCLLCLFVCYDGTVGVYMSCVNDNTIWPVSTIYDLYQPSFHRRKRVSFNAMVMIHQMRPVASQACIYSILHTYQYASMCNGHNGPFGALALAHETLI